MAGQQEYVDYLLDQLQLVGPVRSRRMFGGHGIFLEDSMFALVVDGTLYFKVDEGMKNELLALGLGPFTYARAGKTVALGYFPPPDTAMDDAAELCSWANRALAVALFKGRRGQSDGV